MDLIAADVTDIPEQVLEQAEWAELFGETIDIKKNKRSGRNVLGRLNDIEQERTQIALRTAETRRIHNEALREVLDPLPSAKINNTLSWAYFELGRDFNENLEHQKRQLYVVDQLEDGINRGIRSR